MLFAQVQADGALNWTSIIIAAIVGAPATIAAIGAFIVSLKNSRKQDDTAKKLDENTNLTRTAGVEAKNAAAMVATKAASVNNTINTKVGEIAEKLNGGFDERVSGIVKQHADQLHKVLSDHTEQDESNMLEIRNALADLANQVEKLKKHKE